MGELVPSYREASAIAEPIFLAKEAMKIGQDAVGVNMSKSKFKAQIGALKKQHSQIEEQVDPLVRLGMRNRIQDLGERAKDSMAASPTLGGFAGRFADDDPTTIRLMKDLSAKGLQGKVSLVANPQKAAGLFLDVKKATGSIVTREAMKDNVRAHAAKVLDDVPNAPGVISDVLNANVLDAAKGVAKNLLGKVGRGSKRKAAAVANALMEPADQKAMTRVLQLRHKSERGMVGARRAEMLVGGAGLAGAVKSAPEITKSVGAGYDYLANLTGLASAQ